MKNFFTIFPLICTLVLTSNCGKKSINNGEDEQIKITASQVVNKANAACNSLSPEQSLQWLNDIIKKAEEDRLTKKHMGNYMGKIFLTSYQTRPVFYIKMTLGSGGIYAYIYDCNGNSVSIAGNEMTSFEQQAQQGTLIYSNTP
ncbi:hypothetical protein HRH25_23705 [Flavisolibacter sp. BT320]|nr:hypothetical protein [Flavisolibacter longurius]